MIGLGPELQVPQHCHKVIETNRGTNLGRIILEGQAEPNTHNPGQIDGYSQERVLRANVGVWKTSHKIGDIVEKDEIIGYSDGVETRTQIAGVIRGLLVDDYKVLKNNFKVGDVDPRPWVNCAAITDKARTLAGAVLLACLE